MPEDFDLVIFGGTGDLSRKKLLPALFSGLVTKRISMNSRLIVTTRGELPDDNINWLTTIFKESIPACDTTEANLQNFAQILTIIPLNLTSSGKEWETFSQLIKRIDSSRVCVYFLATPPAIFTSVCELLGQYELIHNNTRVVLEKPLGHDLESAQKINSEVAHYFTESQTFRIDHYLGKEAVQNLMALRFSNILFEELWNNRTIEHIQITIAEDLGVKGRTSFYDSTGAMRDMVQNHLLQLLCLIAMEPPARLDADSIREEKLKVLKSLRPITGETLDRNVVRAQYSEGISSGQTVSSYSEDLGLSKSNTETFVAIKANIENWRWAGVPFYLRTGKRLPDRFAEIVIQFKKIPHTPHTNWEGNINPNRLIIRLQPEDHLAISFMVKNHSSQNGSLKEVEMNLDAKGDDSERLGPYLRLILDAAKGDQSLFVHRDEVEEAWRWVDQIIKHWELDQSDIETYQSGTWGPYKAHDLMNRRGYQWFHETKLKKK